MKKDFIMLGFWFPAFLMTILYAKFAYGELLEDIPTDENIGICGNHCWYDLRGKNLKEWKYEDHIPDVTKKVAPKPIVKAQIKLNDTFDLNKLAYAIAMSETGNCAKGYGKEYNNCFGIKNGNTAPCPKIGRNRMCIYEKPEDSYEAFKKVWSTWYKTFPNRKMAERWSGGDSSETWLKHVRYYYDKE